jgi:hypothetical protein
VTEFHPLFPLFPLPLARICSTVRSSPGEKEKKAKREQRGQF